MRPGPAGRLIYGAGNVINISRVRRAQVVAVALLLGGLPVLAVTPAPAAEDSPGTFAYVRSTNGGNRFSPLELDDADNVVGGTHIVAEDGVVHAVYDSGNNDDAPRQVRYRRSTDAGESFAASVRLDVNDASGAPGNGDSSESDVDADDESVSVVWEDDRLLANGDVDPCCDPDNPAENPSDENRDEVLWTGSTDAGQSFSVPVNLSDSPDVHDTDPDVTVDGERIAVVHESEDIISAAVTDETDVWFPLRRWAGRVTTSPTSRTTTRSGSPGPLGRWRRDRQRGGRSVLARAPGRECRRRDVAGGHGRHVPGPPGRWGDARRGDVSERAALRRRSPPRPRG
jgi:hypothetical protein